MATQIKLRRDLAANWALEDPILAEGEPGYDITNNVLKIGDGSTIWSLLPSIYDPGTDIVPAADNTYDLGSPAKQWRHVYTAGGSIYLDNIKLTNVGGKFVATKVVNPGEDDEAEDPEDSDATSEIRTGVVGLEGVVTNEGDPGEESYRLVLDEQVAIRVHYASGGAANNGFVIGRDNGDTTRANGVVAIGNDDVGFNSKAGGVYIGYQAGWNDTEDPQGLNAIAIGAKAAYDFAEDNSITLNATGATLNPTGAGLFIKPVREDVENTAKAVYYNATTGEMTYTNPTGGGNNSYTPEDLDHWNEPTVNTVAAALDELAARVTALQNYEIDGGNAYTPPEGELLIDGNGA